MRQHTLCILIVFILTLNLIPSLTPEFNNSIPVLPQSTQQVNQFHDDVMQKQKSDAIQGPAEQVYDHLLPMRDVSIPEIEADRVWSMLDSRGLSVTGEGVIIADIDTGVDWKHPDLWFADGESYDWIDDNSNGYVDSGDGIDLDKNGNIQTNERIDIIDTQSDGTYNAELDWIWVESIADDGIPQVGERFFVANDTNSNDILDLGEELIMLNTPKTKYIVEGDGSDPMHFITWERGVNLTTSTHSDTDGHGTAVAGILCGGHPEFREYTGVAPNAELIMVKVFDGGQSNTGIPLYDAIIKATELGADVILIEVGQWIETFMDGSSRVEQLIDDLSESGVPVIIPSGNLGGADKHSILEVVENIPSAVDFQVSVTDTEYVWITALTVNSTDTTQGIFAVSVPTGGNPSYSDVILHPGVGYRNYGFDFESATGIQVVSYIDTSSRGTNMLYLEIYEPGGLPVSAPFRLTIQVNDNCTLHMYIQDSMSEWSGGTVFKTDISNNYIISFPATADSAISVASYHTRSYYEAIGAIASYSACGPRIDGVMQQGVAAPGGYDIISDYTDQSSWISWYSGPGDVLGFVETFGGHRLFSGTSAAAPHVAGCAVLMMQVNPYVSKTIGNIIRNTARQDSFTGSTPNDIWGYGKLNVTAAVLCSRNVNPPNITLISRNVQTVEYDDMVTIVANVTEGSYPINVFLRFGINNQDRPEFRRMGLDDSGNYACSIGTFAYGSKVYYSIYANDSAGVTVESPIEFFLTHDFTSPSLRKIAISPQPAGISAPVLLTIEVFEHANASGLMGVYFNYTVDSWTSNATVEMTYTESCYSGNIPGQPYGVTVGYVIYAVDNAGNRNNTNAFYYSIMDDEVPIIGKPVQSPGQPNSTQIVEVAVTVMDASGLNIVILAFFNGSVWNNVTMSFNGTCYVAEIPFLQNGTSVFYRIYAYDESGNIALSPQYSYTVFDVSAILIVNETSASVSVSDTTNSTTPIIGIMLFLLIIAVLVGLVMVLLNKRMR